MRKAIFIILTLAGFASGAEFEVADRLSVDGSSIFKSTAVFSGSVGIGTASPSTTLHLKGPDASGATYNTLTIEQGNAANKFYFTTAKEDGHFHIREQYLGGINDYVSIRYDNGNVGIGMTGPGTKLSVNGVIGAGGDEIPIQETNFGYYSGYKVLRLGLNQIARSLALNVDPLLISGGNFSGAGQILIGNNGILAPDNAGTNWMGVLRATGGKVYLGGSLSSGDLLGDALVVSGGDVGIGTAGPSSKLMVVDGDIQISTTTGSRGLILQDGTKMITTSTLENIANKSTDATLGGASPSDSLYSSQKAVKSYIDNNNLSRVRAYVNLPLSSPQSVPSGQITKIQYNGKDFDANSEFDNVTNYRFTAKTSGTYLLVAQVYVTVLSNGNNSWI